MKKLVNLSVIIAFVLSCVSCADLDIPSDGRVSLAEIFSRYERTAAYYGNCLGYIPQFGFTYQNQNTPLASFCDEAHDASDNQDGPIANWYQGNTTPSYNPLTATYMDPWSHYTQAIRRCNTFLQCINDPEMATYAFNETEKNGWIAQVRVVRAFYYLQLIKRYGGVPLTDVPYEISHDYSTDRRASFEECADFIISDCDLALATPESEGSSVGFRWQISDNERGKITRAFACAIKSQTALYAASPLWNDNGASKYTWEKAAEITKEALDLCLKHGFELYSKDPDPSIAQNAYAYYFITRSDPSRSWDKETIHETTVWSTNVWRNAATPITKGAEKAGAGPSQELVDSYEMKDGTQPILGYTDANRLKPVINPSSSYDPENPYENRDPRFYASIYYNGAPRYLDDPNRESVETFVGGNCGISDKATDIRYTRTGYYMRKFNNYKSQTGNESDGYMRIFRLAELYLNFAEAANHAFGADVQVASKVGAGTLSAREAVNRIRTRAKMPSLPAGMSKESFDQRYRNERRIELAFEEHRFFDVRRWKILNETDGFVTAMKIEKNEDGTLSYNRIKLESRKTNADKYLIYPIKQTEVSKMLKLTGTDWQNPGW